MQTIKEKAQQLRKEIKDQFGYNSKQISITTSHITYDTKINVTIKDLTINIKDIESIAKPYESIDRCERSYEVLHGGNTYIFIEYSHGLLREKTENQKEMATTIYNNNQNLLHTNNINVIYEDNKNMIYYYHSSNANNFIIELKSYEMVTDKHGTYRKTESVLQYLAYEYNIAEFLTKCLYVFNIELDKISCESLEI